MSSDRCKICGKKIESMTLVEGKAKPCGHIQFSEETIKKHERIIREWRFEYL